jgi:hypothetical protein
MRENINSLKTYFLLGALVFMMFVGCARAGEYYGTDLTGYNHTRGGIAYYSVKIGDGKFAGAGYLGAGSGGGGMTCCIQVPVKWKNKLMATVKFTSSNGINKEVTKDVFIPEYTDENAGHVGVHFLADGNVKVFVSKFGLGHEKYPLRGKEAELKGGVPINTISK